METYFLVGLTSVILLGISAQWLAWRFHLPSILLLLIFGFLAGPGLRSLDINLGVGPGIALNLNPDLIFGSLLFPLVSISVAVILYEGGLTLRFSEIKQVGGVVIALVSVGALITWAISATAAYYVLGLSLEISVLLGAILIVTGPTVIGPLLQQIRPKEPVGSVLKWEGILIDPVGAILAVLVFEAILEGHFHEAPTLIFYGVVETIVIGCVVSFIATKLMIESFKRYWVPDNLQNGASLLFVITAFTISNLLHEEAGLLTVTLMGVILANQKSVSIRHIVEFKENLRVLLISSLFILLASRMEWQQIIQVGLGSLGFVAILLFVARPISVIFSSVRSVLSWREVAFLSWMAPRGIVAAAVASIFAHDLAEVGVAGAEVLASITFIVIVGSVLLYGLTAKSVARWLGVAEEDPQGVLLIGATPATIAIGETLLTEGFKVLIVDSNWRTISTARMSGLATHYGNAIAEQTPDLLDLDGIGYMLAFTSNDEVNSLAALHYAEIFDRSHVYQLSIEHEKGGEVHKTSPQHLRGRPLFGPSATFDTLEDKIRDGATVKATKLTEGFNYTDFQERYQGSTVPLFLITEEQKLLVYTLDYQPIPQSGQTLISLIYPGPGSDLAWVLPIEQSTDVQKDNKQILDPPILDT